MFSTHLQACCGTRHAEWQLLTDHARCVSVSQPRGRALQVTDVMCCCTLCLWSLVLQGDAQLFAIPQPQPCQHQQQQHQHQQQQQRQEQCPEQHSMLGFSFPSAGASSVMSLEGHTFRQLHLAGLQDSEASLLLTTAPGGWMVQVSMRPCLLCDVVCLLSALWFESCLHGQRGHL